MKLCAYCKALLNSLMLKSQRALLVSVCCRVTKHIFIQWLCETTAVTSRLCCAWKAAAAVRAAGKKLNQKNVKTADDKFYVMEFSMAVDVTIFCIRCILYNIAEKWRQNEMETSVMYPHQRFSDYIVFDVQNENSKWLFSFRVSWIKWYFVTRRIYRMPFGHHCYHVSFQPFNLYTLLGRSSVRPPRFRVKSNVMWFLWLLLLLLFSTVDKNN